MSINYSDSVEFWEISFFFFQICTETEKIEKHSHSEQNSFNMKE